MIRRQDGGAAPYLLGGALFLLLLVGGLGLAETARANLIKTAATRALAAAVHSAALSATSEKAFREVLAANLGDARYGALLQKLAPGDHDPATGQRLEHPAVSGRLRFTYEIAYLLPWHKTVDVVLTQTEYLPKRKAAP